MNDHKGIDGTSVEYEGKIVGTVLSHRVEGGSVYLTIGMTEPLIRNGYLVAGPEPIEMRLPMVLGEHDILDPNVKVGIRDPLPLKVDES